MCGTSERSVDSLKTSRVKYKYKYNGDCVPSGSEEGGRARLTFRSFRSLFVFERPILLICLIFQNKSFVHSENRR